MSYKVTVEKIAGTDRLVADLARTTIGMNDGKNEVSKEYMHKMYLCEHSPIRVESYLLTFEEIPYWVVMHFCRHKIGVEHFVSTQRDDRQIDITIPRDKKGQGELVRYRMIVNPQAIIAISRKRLCTGASKETRNAWRGVLEKLKEINPQLVRCCVPDCVYRGHCFEHKTCGYHKTTGFTTQINKYREGINE